jgi:FkbM family methyltransferase
LRSYKEALALVDYALATGQWLTPGGHPATVWYRLDTNDWNTATSCLSADEYRTRTLDFEGPFLDIGGYIGTVSLAVLLDHPNTHAIIVEPLPENLELIERNLAANGLTDRATVIAGLVGSGEVTITYAYRETENDRHHAFVGNAYGRSGTGEHRTVTYQGLSFRDIAPFGVPFVKIDCEGGLWSILHEMTAVPLIAGEAEPVPLPDGTTGSRALLESILGPTHDIEWGAPAGEPGDWGFWAVRR